MNNLPMTPAIQTLLVEENLVDTQIFEALINVSADSSQITFHHARCLAEATTELDTTSFDIVLLDLDASKRKCEGQGNSSLRDCGIDMLQQVRAQAPQLPIVATGSTRDPRMAAAVIKAGAQDYWVKPDRRLVEGLTQENYQDRYADLGNLLVTTIWCALQRAELSQQFSLSKERYELAVYGANDGIWDWDLRNHRVYYSDRWCSMLGLCAQKMGEQPSDWFARIHPSDRAQFQQALKAHLTQKHRQFHCEYRIKHSDGTYRWMLTRGASLWDKQGTAYRMAGSQIDITDRKALENSLHQEKELAQITLHSIGDAVITTDRQGLIEDFNPVAERLTGWQASDARHKPITEVCTLLEGNSRLPLSNPAMRAIEEGQAVMLSHQSTLISKTGEECAVSDSAAPIRSKEGEIIGTVLVLRDVSEQKSRTAQLAWQASHDPLTQLCNRAHFARLLDQAITDTQHARSQHVLCYLDLDHFKVINDTCGHTAGDQLLKQIADLWRARIRVSDSLARLGGDEFGLLLYNCNISKAKRIAQDFCDSIEAFQFNYDNKVFKVGVSIGVVMLSAEITGTEELMSLADQACYQAKEHGRNRIAVHRQKAQHFAKGPNPLQWQARLNHALTNNQFRLYQQSIASTGQLRVEHEEVFLRLHNPESGQMMPPMGFIPTAERYHLMPQIDQWVVQRVLEHIDSAIEPSAVATSTAETSTAKTTDCSSQTAQSINPSAQIADLSAIYSINLSAASVYDDGFLDFLQQQLAHRSDIAGHLCFEITETVAIANLQKTAQFTAALQQLGCQVAIDDFGTSLSALTYFKDLCVNYLKISGRFIKEAATDTVTYTMLCAIHQVAQAMKIKTIAKSVESDAILKTITAIGIGLVQGYEVGPLEPLVTSARPSARPHYVIQADSNSAKPTGIKAKPKASSTLCRAK